MRPLHFFIKFASIDKAMFYLRNDSILWKHRVKVMREGQTKCKMPPDND